jgi:hypothetical protein
VDGAGLGADHRPGHLPVAVVVMMEATLSEEEKTDVGI